MRSRVCSTVRSSSEWQHNSGNVGVPFGDGPRSPTMSSSAPRIERLVVEHVREQRRALERRRQRAGTRHGLGDEAGPLGRQPGAGIEAFLTQALDAGSHHQPPRWTVRPRARSTGAARVRARPRAARDVGQRVGAAEPLVLRDAGGVVRQQVDLRMPWARASSPMPIRFWPHRRSRQESPARARGRRMARARYPRRFSRIVLFETPVNRRCRSSSAIFRSNSTRSALAATSMACRLPKPGCLDGGMQAGRALHASMASRRNTGCVSGSPPENVTPPPD